MTTNQQTILDWSLPWSTRSLPCTIHQDRGVRHATGALSKICGRGNITIGTWNMRTLRTAGKLQELTHQMDRYRWNILGLFDVKLQQRKVLTAEKKGKATTIQDCSEKYLTEE